jgi:hypothetical protein
MATTIVTKNSSTASAVPTAGQLVQGELAVNVADKRLYTEDNAGAIVELGTNPSTLTVTGEITANGGIALGDNDIATFGASDDLQIYHDGTHSRIVDAGTGNLNLQGDNLRLKTADAVGTYLEANNGGAVTITYNSSPKLATTTTGIDVTGTALADTLETSTGSGGLLNIIRDDPTIGIDNSLGAIYWKSTEDSGTTVNIGAGILALADQNHSTVASGSRLSFSTTAVSSTSATERLRISSGGDISFYEDTGTTAKLFWDASAESLGIGTSSPSEPLTVLSAQDYQITAAYNAANSTSYGYYGIKNNNTGNPFYFNVGGAERMRIDSSGNVGIGTSSPSQKLSVADGAHITGANATAADTSGSYTLAVGANAGARSAIFAGDVIASGKVGIGTSSPDDDLHIANNTQAGPALRLENQSVSTDSNTIYASINFEGNDNSAGANGIRGSIVGKSESSNGAMGLLFSTASAGGANTERMRISGAALLVGKTAANGGTAGVEASAAAFNATVSGDTVSRLNRLSSDGEILRFQKDTATVGSIATVNGDLLVGTGDTGLRFHDTDNRIYPINTSGGAKVDATIDLGDPTGRFKDLYLSGGLRGDTLTFGNLAGTERMRIDSSGNLLVGTTGVPNGTSVYGAGFINTGASGLVQWASGVSTATSVSVARFYNPNGNVGSIQLAGTATSYVTSSDQRLKENITDANDAGDKIDAIKVRQYDWKADGSHQDYGMVAQELQLVAPEAVSGDADSEEMMGVDYSKLVPMLIKEIQSLRNRVAQLEGI